MGADGVACESARAGVNTAGGAAKTCGARTLPPATAEKAASSLRHEMSVTPAPPLLPPVGLGGVGAGTTADAFGADDPDASTAGAFEVGVGIFLAAGGASSDGTSAVGATAVCFGGAEGPCPCTSPFSCLCPCF